MITTEQFLEMRRAHDDGRLTEARESIKRAIEGSAERQSSEVFAPIPKQLSEGSRMILLNELITAGWRVKFDATSVYLRLP